MNDVELYLDESNELVFDITIEGNLQSTKDPEFRLFCEEKDFSFAFKGEKTKDGVKFTVPQLNEFVSPGKHDMQFEVVVDNKRFIPMKFEANFIKERISIKSESVSIKKINKETNEIAIKSNLIKDNKKEDFPTKIKKITAKELREILRGA